MMNDTIAASNGAQPKPGQAAKDGAAQCPLRCLFAHATDPLYADTQNYGAMFMPVQAYTLAAQVPEDGRFEVRLFPVGVDTAKELIYARLKIKEPGPGYCHFPAHYDDEYFRQLTAEQIVTRFSKGFRKREWKKIRPRNEALDCRVYALAAYALLNANINQIANRIDRKIEVVEPKPEPVSPARRIRRSKQQNWVNGWRQKSGD